MMADRSRYVDPLYSADEPLVGPGSVAAWIDELQAPVAVTGGTGFVGSHLIDTLCAAGAKPRVLVRNLDAPRWIAGRDVTWIEGDLENRRALEELVEGAKTVFHLAGVLRGATDDDFMRGNRDGTERVVAAVQATADNPRFVHVSSQAAIGPSPTADGLGPEALPQPISAYGRSKAAAEEKVRAMRSASWAMLRPPAVYGPRDSDVFEFFRLASRGVLAYPAGERWITMAYVGDVVAAILSAATVGESGGVYHVGAPRALTMDALLRDIAEAGGVRARALPVPAWVFRVAGAGASALRAAGFRNIPLSRDKAREILARHWALSTEESMRRLGMDAACPFSVGAENTWRWYRRIVWLP